METKVGDFDQNFEKITSSYKTAESKNFDFCITTEMAISGYPPKDLLLRDDFIKKTNYYISKLVKFTKNKKCILCLGSPVKEKEKLFNSLLIIKNGIIVDRIDKNLLPNYGVFDEKRYFSPGIKLNNIFKFGKKKIGFLICEDFWDDNFISKLNKNKIDFLIIINASPFEKKKNDQRIKTAKKRVDFLKCPIFYLNLVGTQDDLIFDGGSFLINEKKIIEFQAPFFLESNIEITHKNNDRKKKFKFSHDRNELIYSALNFSLKKYYNDNSFSKIIIGISGGIDSALTAALACDAIGFENVTGYFLPSQYTSKESFTDAYELSDNLQFKLCNIDIQPFIQVYKKQLKKIFNSNVVDVTEENIQSRIRGNILMAISNKYNALLLSTGNKSEMAVGYSTLYGDMCGGFSLLKDIYKTEVFRLSTWRNNNKFQNSKLNKPGIIPNNILTKEPTAELNFNQKDTDSLPSYDILDEILYYLIDENLGIEKIIKKGFKEKLVLEIWKMVKNSEFKRFQSSIGPKVSSMSFDNDRRFPIVNKFKL